MNGLKKIRIKNKKPEKVIYNFFGGVLIINRNIDIISILNAKISQYN